MSELAAAALRASGPMRTFMLLLCTLCTARSTIDMTIELRRGKSKHECEAERDQNHVMGKQTIAEAQDGRRGRTAFQVRQLGRGTVPSDELSSLTEIAFSEADCAVDPRALCVFFRPTSAFHCAAGAAVQFLQRGVSAVGVQNVP